MKFLNISFFEGYKPSLIFKQKYFYKPWGYYQILEETSNYKVKKLFLNPNSQISLQSHEKRIEHWVVVSGIANIILNEEKFQLKVNQSVTIERKVKHMLSNKTKDTLIIIETQIGSYLGEDDIIRYQDIYKRK